MKQEPENTGLKECYTVIATDLEDPILMRLETFIDREKMRNYLLKFAKEHRRCIVVPGTCDDVDYQVEYEEDEKTIKTIHFEDEPDYKPFFGLFDLKSKILPQYSLVHLKGCLGNSNS